MSEQPEALRLADALENLEATGWGGDCFALTERSEKQAARAASELRRLHALCEEMGEALEGLDNRVRRVFRDNRWFWEDYPEIIKAAEVRAKWRQSE